MFWTAKLTASGELARKPASDDERREWESAGTGQRGDWTDHGWRTHRAGIATARISDLTASRGTSKTPVKWNVLPWPASLSSQILPPIKWTSREQIVRPKPVPPYSRVVEPSA